MKSELFLHQIFIKTMSDYQKLLEDVIHDRIKASMLRQHTEDTYKLRFKSLENTTPTDVLISASDLRAVDERLPEVAAAMASITYGQNLSIRRLQTTILSHWARANHTLDVTLGDDLYDHQKSPKLQHLWYLNKIKSIERLDYKPGFVQVRLLCYRIATTKNGIEYVEHKTECRLNRRNDWLDTHLRNGSNIVDLIESLGLTNPDLSNFLQSQYLAVSLPELPGLKIPTDVVF